MNLVLLQRHTKNEQYSGVIAESPPPLCFSPINLLRLQLFVDSVMTNTTVVHTFIIHTFVQDKTRKRHDFELILIFTANFVKNSCACVFFVNLKHEFERV